MEIFLIRGWDLSLPVSGATSTLAGGATLAARWLHEPQPVTNQPVGLWFPPCAAVSTLGIFVFVAGLLELYSYGRISHPGMGIYLPLVRRELGVGPRGNSRGVLAP